MVGKSQAGTVQGCGGGVVLLAPRKKIAIGAWKAAMTAA